MAPLSRYRSPDDMPPALPLFPLRGAILLPRSDLPLNVFEPRYLAMVDDAIAGQRLVGIVQPEQTMQPIESPTGKQVPLKRIGCAGRITAFQEHRDGRMHITLTGIARFVIESEAATDSLYRIASVAYTEYRSDFLPDASVDAIDRPRLMEKIRRFLDARHLEADWNAIAKAPLEPLVNNLSAMSPFGPEEKQALLEAPDLKARAEVLMTLADMAVAGNSSSGTTIQ